MRGSFDANHGRGFCPGRITDFKDFINYSRGYIVNRQQAGEIQEDDEEVESREMSTKPLVLMDNKEIDLSLLGTGSPRAQHLQGGKLPDLRTQLAKGNRVYRE